MFIEKKIYILNRYLSASFAKIMSLINNPKTNSYTFIVGKLLTVNSFVCLQMKFYKSKSLYI